MAATGPSAADFGKTARTAIFSRTQVVEDESIAAGLAGSGETPAAASAAEQLRAEMRRSGLGLCKPPPPQPPPLQPSIQPAEDWDAGSGWFAGLDGPQPAPPKEAAPSKQFLSVAEKRKAKKRSRADAADVATAAAALEGSVRAAASADAVPPAKKKKKKKKAKLQQEQEQQQPSVAAPPRQGGGGAAASTAGPPPSAAAEVGPDDLFAVALPSLLPSTEQPEEAQAGRDGKGGGAAKKGKAALKRRKAEEGDAAPHVPDVAARAAAEEEAAAEAAAEAAGFVAKRPTCRDCQKGFTFTAARQQQLASRGFTGLKTRCEACTLYAHRDRDEMESA